MADAKRRQQKTETLATLYVGKLRLERRNGAPKIFARAFVQGKHIVRTTGEQTLSAATKVATDWYLDLRDRMRKGERLHGRLFAYCADAFIAHADLLREVSDGQRKNYKEKWNLLKEHFDGVKVTDVDTKFLLELREKRSRKQNKNGDAVKAATLKKDLDSCGSCCDTPSTLKSASTNCRNSRRFAARLGKSFRRRARSSTTSSG